MGDGKNGEDDDPFGSPAAAAAAAEDEEDEDEDNDDEATNPNIAAPADDPFDAYISNLDGNTSPDPEPESDPPSSTRQPARDTVVPAPRPSHVRMVPLTTDSGRRGARMVPLQIQPKPKL
ncbi:MAG: hypothetical protein Q7S96_00075 [bacterium]|nr:hypothetical protein [bacterium]